MKNSILLFLPLMGCATFQMADGMNYRGDIDDKWDTHCPSYGDCEDAVLCQSRRMGGGILATTTSWDGKDHAVFVFNGEVYDILGQTRTIKQLAGAVSCDLGTGKSGILLPSGKVMEMPALSNQTFGKKCAEAVKELKND